MSILGRMSQYPRVRKVNVDALVNRYQSLLWTELICQTNQKWRSFDRFYWMTVWSVCPRWWTREHAHVCRVQHVTISLSVWDTNTAHIWASLVYSCFQWHNSSECISQKRKYARNGLLQSLWTNSHTFIWSTLRCWHICHSNMNVFMFFLSQLKPVQFT